MNDILRKINIFLLFLTPVALLYVPDNMFFPFISGKGLLFRLLVEIALGLYIYSVIKDKTLLPKKGPLLILTSIFTLWVLIADLASPIISKAFWSNFERMEGFVLIGHLWAYFIMLTSVFRLREDWQKFFYSILTTAIAMSLFALLQITGGTAINQGGVRLDSLMGNSAYFAGFCLVSFFIGLLLFKEDIKKSRSIAFAFFIGAILFCLVYVFGEKKTLAGNTISGLAILLSSIALWLSYSLKKNRDNILSITLFSLFSCTQIYLMFLTQTRGAAMGLLGGLFVGSLFLAIFEKKGVLKKVSISIISSIILLIGIFIAVKETAFVKQSPVLNRFAEISWSNTSGQARQIIWPMALEGFKERPIMGWGQEGFNYVFAKYYDIELWKHEPWFDRTHNVFLDWLVATGSVGFLLYISLYGTLLFLIIKAFFKEDKLTCAILIGLLTGYAFGNLFIFDNLGSYIFFFSLLAFIHHISTHQSEEPLKSLKRSEKKDVHSHLAAYLAIGVSISLFFFCVYKPYIQSTSMIKGLSPQKNITDNLEFFKKAIALGGGGIAEAREQLASITNQILPVGQVSMDIKRAFFMESLTQAQKHKQDWPEDSKTLLSLGASFNQNGNPDIALDFLTHIQKRSPNKQHILMQIAISYLLKGDIAQAKEILKQTYELSPDFTDVATLYASVLIDRSEYQEALKILDEIAERGEPLKPYIIANLKQKGFEKELINLFKEILKKTPDQKTQDLLKELER